MTHCTLGRCRYTTYHKGVQALNFKLGVIGGFTTSPSISNSNTSSPIISSFCNPDGATNTLHGRSSSGPPTRIETPPPVPCAYPTLKKKGSHDCGIRHFTACTSSFGSEFKTSDYRGISIGLHDNKTIKIKHTEKFILKIRKQ